MTMTSDVSYYIHIYTYIHHNELLSHPHAFSSVDMECRFHQFDSTADCGDASVFIITESIHCAGAGAGQKHRTPKQ